MSGPLSIGTVSVTVLMPHAWWAGSQGARVSAVTVAASVAQHASRRGNSPPFCRTNCWPSRTRISHREGEWGRGGGYWKFRKSIRVLQCSDKCVVVDDSKLVSQAVNS